MSDDLLGTELEHYQLVRRLGEGGMGVVYEAEDLALRRKVAVKVLAPALLEDQRARRRFQAEIAHAVAIEHPFVVPVYGAGYDRGVFFLVLRLIDGPDISRELRRAGRFSEARTLRLLGQIASALWAVHSLGMVHRDVKPHNALLGACGQPDEHAMLTDFGIAKALDDTGSLTGVGAIGTPNYMAPEVCAGGAASPRSDQYSLACMAYEMLAGHPPFAHAAGDVRDAHLEADPPPLGDAVPELHPAVVAAIHRGLEKQPERRFDDIRELIDVDARSRRSFDEATTLTQVITGAATSDQAAETLAGSTTFSDRSIAALTNSTTQSVARARRRAARDALIGPSRINRPPQRGSRFGS